MTELTCITVDTGENPNAAVIWLHGLGASGDDFRPIVPHLNLPSDLQVRFIFPNAPEIPVTVNGGYVMPAWYDILELSLERKIDVKQIMASSSAIEQIIDAQVTNGIPSERIILAGFSQGGAVAYQCALHYPKKLAGLLAMSTYIATEATLSPHPANQNTEVQIHHGTNDDVVPFELGQKALATLTEKHYKVELQRYAMAHEVCFEQIQDIGKLITRWLST